MKATIRKMTTLAVFLSFTALSHAQEVRDRRLEIAQALVAEGKAHLEKGEFAEAERVLGNAKLAFEADNASFVELATLLGFVWLRQGRDREAFAILEDQSKRSLLDQQFLLAVAASRIDRPSSYKMATLSQMESDKNLNARFGGRENLPALTSREGRESVACLLLASSQTAPRFMRAWAADQAVMLHSENPACNYWRGVTAMWMDDKEIARNHLLAARTLGSLALREMASARLDEIARKLR